MSRINETHKFQEFTVVCLAVALAKTQYPKPQTVNRDNDIQSRRHFNFLNRNTVRNNENLELLILSYLTK